MACGDVLSLEDLQTAKKHQIFEAEVITGKAGGVAGGATIGTATNPVTGQTQQTLPSILADLGFDVQSWTSSTGGVLASANQVFLNDTPGSLGLGDYYAWGGPFPKTVPAGTDPALPTSGYIMRSSRFAGTQAREALRRSYAEAGYNLVEGSFEAGGTLVNANDVLLQERTGKVFSGPAGTVPAGSTPSSAWIDRSTAPNAFKLSDVAGAVSRTVYSKLRDVISVKDFGAVGTGAVDDTAAIQAAIDYATSLSTSPPNRGAVVTFPPGQYLCTATLMIRGSRIALRGDGSFHSQIVRNANYGPTIQVQSVTAGALNLLERIEVSGLTLYHDVSAGVAMTDPHIIMSAVTHGRITDLDINNGAYGIVLYGGVDVEVQGTNVIGVNSTGANNSIGGIVLKDAAASGFTAGGVVELPTQIHFLDCEVFGPLNSGWQYGLIINAAEDITVSNTYLGNCKANNVLIQQDARNKQILEISFTDGTYIDGSGADSVRIEGLAGNGSAYIGTVSFIGIDIKGQGGQTPGSGIFVDGTARGGAYSQACRNLRVIGCRIGDYNFNGVWIVGCVNALISGNQIGGNNYNNTQGGRGLLIGGACDRVLVTGNRIGGLPEGNGTSLQTAGIELVAGATGIMIDGNDLRNNVTALIDSTAANTASPSVKRITNNAGFNENRPATAPSMPASATDLYNPYGSPCWVSVFGGTVSDIKLNGQTISGATGAMFPVGPGDRVRITYTVAPSWAWWPM